MKPRTGSIEELRTALEDKQGPRYWRSLEELSDTQEFQDYLHREFPESASELDDVSRRGFLKLMGASLALAGLSACTKQPAEHIVPYVRQPEELIPGHPLFYASAYLMNGYAQGILAESHMGRPTKIEGNPEHPASLGGSNIYMQAAILDLYDPDRSQSMTHLGNIGSWGDFLTMMQARMATEKGRPNPGAGLRILTETITSPTLAAQLRELLNALPEARWIQYDPAGNDEARKASMFAFGQYVENHYRIKDADVIFSLEGDFIGYGPAHLRYTREFSSRRRGDTPMNRLYVAESTPSQTGAVSDHRFRVRSSEIPELARQLHQAVVGGAQPSDNRFSWLAAVVKDLNAHRGTSLVVAGSQQPAAVQAIAHAVNAALGNVGKTVIYTDPVEANPEMQLESLKQLCLDMNAGKVETLLIVGGNPVFNAPADYNFADNLNKVPLRIHLSLYEDETSNVCHWHVPNVHSLESWTDARAYDGTASIVQPLIAPLYEGCRSIHEILSAMMGQTAKKAHDAVQEYWKTQYTGANFEKDWRRWLHDGMIPNTALPEKAVTAKTELPPMPAAAPETEFTFRPDPCVYDGRFANNGWLQELPRPFTTVTWDSVILVSPKTAAKTGIQNGDMLEIQINERAVIGPAWVLPGQADDSFTVQFGNGRAQSGRVGTAVGFNGYLVRQASGFWTASGSVRKTGSTYKLAPTQHHHMMEGRDLVRSASHAEFQKNPHVFESEHESAEHLDLFPEYEYKGYAWGMAIDLSACVGCNACMIACVSENNIPVVGKNEVTRGREMHWIRVDRYFEGSMDEPTMHQQPVPCMHCEKAPCEVVCPVAATAHSSEGLNDMVYNRCVGTRYCSNNCPYKVRRFNFFLYNDLKTPSLKMMRNPDVTVRTRGVMEKCTYCVQRINEAKIATGKEDRRVRDGEILTACQQACPADAIVFGDINDKGSRVAKLRADDRHYALIGELNTKPRTTYLANLRNPNPEVKS